MLVTLEARTPCMLCGFRFRILMFASVRVNKRSMRTTAPMIGALGEHRCPECGTPNAGDLRPRTTYVLDPESVAKVAQYRQRRWGIDEPDAVPVERRAS